MPTADELDTVQRAQQVVETRKTELSRIEAREETFRADLDRFKEHLREQGIDPANLDALVTEAQNSAAEAVEALKKELDGDKEAGEDPGTPT